MCCCQYLIRNRKETISTDLNHRSGDTSNTERPQLVRSNPLPDSFPEFADNSRECRRNALALRALVFADDLIVVLDDVLMRSVRLGKFVGTLGPNLG